MIKNLKPRLYQETILAASSEKNTLVVLPTGMGKSIIFVMLASQRLKNFPNSRVIVMAPTKPLCEQHVKTLKEFLEIDNIELLTGAVKPEKRREIFNNSKIVVSTPQGLENDIVSNRIDFKDVSLMVFDECHRAVKDYSYTWLAKNYVQNSKFPRILGLTASPGSEVENIKEVCNNLSIENIEVRTDQDPDVKPYIQEVETSFVKVELTDEFKRIKEYLMNLIKDRKEKVSKLGVDKNKISSMNKKELLELQGELQGRVARGEKEFDILRSLSMLAEIIKVQHAIELLETQGISAISTYFDKIFEENKKKGSRAVKNIVQDINFRSAKILIDRMAEREVEHPKIGKLKEIIREDIKKCDKIIVFNNYRDNANKVVEELNNIDNVKAELFVGQAKKSGTGMTQKEQGKMLERFRNNEFNVVVMTSVGEEGLDIPKVDEVIFFEPVPSAIRNIQRKGRTGRLEKGKVIVLYTKGSIDEAYRWSAYHKEKGMYNNLKDLKDKILFEKEEKEQQTIGSYHKKENLKVYADHREKTSKVIKELMDNGVEVELKTLEIADYIVSDNVGIELKTVPDFVNSIIDGRLIEQMKDLRYNFLRPVLLIEGEEDIYSVRNVHPNSVRGMLSTVAVSYGVPIIYTKNPKDTAQYLITISRRENEKDSSYSPHPSKRGISLKEQQENFIASLPDIGLKLARQLLEKFKSPKKIVNASEERLKKAANIGENKAKKLRKLFDKED